MGEVEQGLQRPAAGSYRSNERPHTAKNAAGLPLVRIEALVQAVILTKTRLQAVGQENQLFASCFTIGTLVEKLELTAQSSCCLYLAERPGRVLSEVF